MTISLGAPQRPDHPRSDTELRWAEAGGKRFFVLRQKGSLPEISYDHGQLLAEEIENGVFPEIVDTIRTGTDVASDTGDWVLSAVYRRMSDDVFNATEPEFQAAIRALGDGMFDRLDNPRFTPEDVRDALVAIDTGNLADGLTRRMQKPLAAEATDTIVYVLGAVRRFRRGRVQRMDDVGRDRDQLGRDLQPLSDISRRVGFGCTAAGAAPGETADGLGLHARSFDGAFFDWNRTPGLMIVDERGTNPAWHRYVAVGTAGLVYSGGISGLNDQGLACSIHQMSTAQTDNGRPGRGYALAPYLQQRILREAANLDEAEAILRGARHFAAWTIVVSDAKTGTAARFEICGGRQHVARMDLGARFAQSNHFLSDALAERHDHFDDAHFTPTFGKWLESRARLVTVEAAEGKGRPDTDWAIALLSSHADGALDGAERSFGRTICKAYGLMGTVARTDPDRARAADQIWFAIGDRCPGPHSGFAGFDVDWQALELRPVADRPLRRPSGLSAAFAEACAAYVAAFRAMARPVDATGAYLGRDPDDAERAACRTRALGHLDRACTLAENAGEIDPAFRYARARLRLDAGDLAGAAEDWAFLRSLADGAVRMHDWERVLIWTLSGATEEAAGRSGAALAAAARRHLDGVRRASFPGTARPHPDLAAWEAAIAEVEAGRVPDLPKFDFVTVE